jgi:integrase/recombinase XerD
MSTTVIVPSFASLIREFFCRRLIAQQNASAWTAAAYRDTFRLLLNFFAERRDRPPTVLTLADLVLQR